MLKEPTGRQKKKRNEKQKELKIQNEMTGMI